MLDTLNKVVQKSWPTIQKELTETIIGELVKNACYSNKDGICAASQRKTTTVRCNECDNCNIRRTVKIALVRLAEWGEADGEEGTEGRKH